MKLMSEAAADGLLASLEKALARHRLGLRF